MRALVRSEVEVAASARAVWDYVTDWPRQGEWIPLTRVEPVGAPSARVRQVGGRIRAWTGVGPVGFWDTMTITGWDESWLPDGGGSAVCEVLHTGRVVRGDGEFAVHGVGPAACTFVWWERLDVPGGRVGWWAWRLGGWTMSVGVDRALAGLARRAAVQSGAGGGP